MSVTCWAEAALGKRTRTNKGTKSRKGSRGARAHMLWKFRALMKISKFEHTCSESLKLSWKFESLSPHPLKVWSYHEKALMKVWTQVPHALKVWAQIRRPTNKEMAYMGNGKNTDEPAVAKKKLMRKDTNQSITAAVHVLCTMNLLYWTHILLLCRSSHNLDSFSITCLPKEMNGYFLH